MSPLQTSATFRLVLLDRAGGVRLAGTLAFPDAPEAGDLLRYESAEWRVLEVDGPELLLEPA